MIYLPTEEDEYKPCAGDAMRKCVIGAQTGYEKKIKRSIVLEEYIKCYEKAKETCDAAKSFFNDFIGYLKVYHKFAQLFEKIVSALQPQPWSTVVT